MAVLIHSPLTFPTIFYKNIEAIVSVTLQVLSVVFAPQIELDLSLLECDDTTAFHGVEKLLHYLPSHRHCIVDIEFHIFLSSLQAQKCLKFANLQGRNDKAENLNTNSLSKTVWMKNRCCLLFLSSGGSRGIQGCKETLLPQNVNSTFQIYHC